MNAQQIVDNLLDEPDGLMDRIGFPEQFKIGTHVRLRSTVPDVVVGGETGVITGLPQPGWAEVELDTPNVVNNYPFNFMELEPL